MSISYPNTHDNLFTYTKNKVLICVKMLSKEDIEDIENSFIQVVVGVVTGTTAGIIVLMFMRLEFNSVHPLYAFVLGTVFVTAAVLIAFLGIVGCKYIVRRLR